LYKKILLIEDEKIDALRIGRAIGQTFPHASVEVLTTGEQALDWLLRFRGEDGLLSLILMDLTIPRMNGLDLLAEFKHNEFVKNVPIVILSSNEDPEAVRIAYRAGASAYVVKPAATAEALAKLSSTLDFWLNVNLTPLPTGHKSVA